MKSVRHTSRVVSVILSAPLLCGFPIMSVVAQDRAGDDTTQLEAIEVIGTRIKKAELEGQSPVLSLSRQDLEATGISSIGDILQRIVEISRATFAEKHVTISIDTDVPAPYALGDAMLCYSLFQNLIKNACEATPEKSRWRTRRVT